MSPKNSAWYRTKYFNLVLGLLVTGGCLAWAFYVMQGEEEPGAVWQKIANAFARADYRSLPIFWLCLFLFYWLKAWRWRLLLTPIGSYRTMGDLYGPLLTGFAFNNLLPAHLGEFVRVYVFARQHRASMTAVFSSVVLERIFDLIAILLFLGLGFWMTRQQMQIDQMDQRIRIGIYIFVAATVLGLVGAFAYLIWTRQCIAIAGWCLNRLDFFPEGPRERLLGMLQGGAQGLASLRSGSLLRGIIITSLLQWLLDGLMIHIGLLAFDVKVSFWVSLVVLGISAVGVMVPSSPGYFGVIQVCYVATFKLYSNDDPTLFADVFASSLYFHVAQWVPVTLIGLIFFNRYGLKVADVEKASQVEST